MIDIGINYITGLEGKNNYDDIYKLLIKRRYITTLKFPGKSCDYNTLENLLKLTQITNSKIDIHGIPKMLPSICSKQCVQKINWEELREKLSINNQISRISTHIGLDRNDKLNNYKKEKLERNLETNKKVLKNQLKEIVGNEIELGLENIPGGFHLDIETIKPQYISENWEKADFGVFDISHAKLAAKSLNMTYEDYTKEIENKEKVKILHISGDIDELNKYPNSPDKHILIHQSEIKDIIQTLELFENIDLVVSEYAYNTKYSYEKEIIIESIIISIITQKRNEKIAKNALNYLEQNLKEDICNIEEILDSKEWHEINK